jgi:long-chain acyl-CoA synthetase
MGDTLPKLFLQQVKKLGSKVALREKYYGIWNEVTWNEYYSHVRNVSLGLMELGLRKGDKVCIQSENNQEWLYADLAVQSAHGVTVGIYPTNPAVEIKYLINNSDAVFYFAEDQEQVDKVLEIRDECRNLKKIIVMNMKGVKTYNHPDIMSFKNLESLGEEVAAKKPDLFENLVSETRAEDICLIIYTSGTTALPKGALICHRNLVEQSKILFEYLGLNGDEVLISYLPLCHAFERVFALYLPLLKGCVVNFAESIDTIQFDVREIAPTVFVGVPRIWEKIQENIVVKIQNTNPFNRFVYHQSLKWGYRIYQVREEKKGKGAKLPWHCSLLHLFLYFLVFRALQKHVGLRKATFLYTAGAPISPEIIKFFHVIGLDLEEGFGMTELSNVGTLQPRGRIRIGTIGLPVPGTEIRIAEDHEMLFKAPGVFMGYYKMREETQETLKDGWLHSGDLGEIDNDGHVKIIGRKKDIIITSGGKNISPELLESKLKASPYIREAVIIGDGRKYLSALIQIETDTVGDWARARNIPYTTIKDLSNKPEVLELIGGEMDRVNSQVARVERVRKFKLIDKELYHEEGDVTATQKIKRKILMEKFSDLVDSLYA